MYSEATRKKRVARFAWSACLLAACALPPPAGAQVSDWAPELVRPPEGIFGPGDPIRLRLPELPVEVLQNLALELDDFDVTEFVSRDGDLAVLVPPQPLSYGEHRLRLVEYAPDGSIVERGAWTLSVRKTAAFREAGLNAATTLTAARRISAEDLPQPVPAREQWNGGAQLQGALADGSWRFKGRADLLGNSEETLLPRGEQGGNVDLGHFLLEYGNGPVIARAGHHSVGPESLIMSSFQRRGVSAGVQSAATGASATAFSLRTAEVIGFEEGLGVGETGNRTDGVTASFRPLAGQGGALVVSATYLEGEGPSQTGEAGTGIAGDPVSVEGSAASVIADATLLESRLRLRGEYAKTRFDFDGDGTDTDLDGMIDTDFAPERADAYSALVTYLPWHEKAVLGEPLVWNLGVESRRIGTFFRSPANPVGVSDRELLRGFTGVNWSGLDAQLSLGRERDNVDDLPSIARTETAQRVLSLTYTPPGPLPGPDGSLPPPPWYGQPVLNATYLDVEQDVIKAGSGLPTGALSAVDTLSLSASFTYPTWSWTVGHTMGESEDFFGFGPDTETTSSQLSANFQVGERLTLGPLWQISKTDESDPPAGFGFTSRRLETVTAGLTAGYIFTDGLNANLGYNLNRTEASDGSQDGRSASVTASFAWTVVPAREVRPGLTLSLDGQYNDLEEGGAFPVDQSHYQVFLKAAVSWLPSW